MGGSLHGETSTIFFCSNYWVGLHMESRAGGSAEFHWGDCVPNTDVTSDFDSLTYSEGTACGYVRSDSLRLTACSNTVSMGFICENPNGKTAVCRY